MLAWFLRLARTKNYRRPPSQAVLFYERVLPLEFTDIFHAYSHHTVCTLLSVSICFVKILSRVSLCVSKLRDNFRLASKLLGINSVSRLVTL